MNSERYIELDRSGTGLTKEEWEDRIRHGLKIVMNLTNAALAKEAK